MSEATHHYCIFKTAGGYCGIAWNAAGIIRFQLPTKTESSTEQLLLRRLSSGVSADPPAAVAATIESVKRYFAGETVDFSDVVVDLSNQDEFFREIYAAARRVGWGRTTTYGTLAKELGPVIAINAICPGVIRTEIDTDVTDRAEEVIKGIALGRLGCADDVARLVTFLATSEPCFMTGQTLTVDGFQFNV